MGRHLSVRFESVDSARRKGKMCEVSGVVSFMSEECELIANLPQAITEITLQDNESENFQL
jgi:hypothetical protein